MQLAERDNSRADFAGPLAQSVRIAFRTLYIAVLLLAAGWVGSNVRQVPADSRVVVLRFGRVDRVQEAGLVLAWPSPIEETTLLPARDRPIELKIEKATNEGLSSETDFQIRQPDDVIQLRTQKDARNGQYFLTGDGSVVQFDATLFFRIVDPVAYFLSREHVAPALQRLYRASAVALTASRDLDDFLVARPEQEAETANAEVTTQRQALREDLVAAVNQRLLELQRHGTQLGVEVSRIDVVALLPPVAKAAFDEVLTATQTADQGAAAARIDAAHVIQEADRDRDRVRSEAAAAAEERIRSAAADTANIKALEAQITPVTRDALLMQYYREEIGAALQKIGRVTAVDAGGHQRLILPGSDQ